MFAVGDKVRCINSRVHGYINHLPGLAHLKKLIVTEVRNWPDGSQQIWVQHKKWETPVGPYLSTRFVFLAERFPTYAYDPNQQGDRDEDI